MMIKQLLLSHTMHSHETIMFSKLSQADRAKFTRHEIKNYVQDNLLLGRLNACEAVLKAHKLQPYASVDELIGDLQIVLVHTNEQLRSSNMKHLQKVSVEDLIGDHSAG